MQYIQIKCLSVFGKKQIERWETLRKIEFIEMQLGSNFHVKYNFIKSICTLDTTTGELIGFFYNINKPDNWNDAKHFILSSKSKEEDLDITVEIDENGNAKYFINTMYIPILLSSI